MEHCGQTLTRRGLLTGILRYATLGALGVISGIVLAKRHRLEQEDICINHGVCRGCGIFQQCGLPQALSKKQLLTRADDDRK